MQQTCVQPLGGADPLKKGMATHSSPLGSPKSGTWLKWPTLSHFQEGMEPLFLVGRGEQHSWAGNRTVKRERKDSTTETIDQKVNKFVSKSYPGSVNIYHLQLCLLLGEQRECLQKHNIRSQRLSISPLVWPLLFLPRLLKIQGAQDGEASSGCPAPRLPPRRHATER